MGFWDGKASRLGIGAVLGDKDDEEVVVVVADEPRRERGRNVGRGM